MDREWRENMISYPGLYEWSPSTRTSGRRRHLGRWLQSHWSPKDLWWLSMSMWTRWAHRLPWRSTVRGTTLTRRFWPLFLGVMEHPNLGPMLINLKTNGCVKGLADFGWTYLTLGPWGAQQSEEVRWDEVKYGVLLTWRQHPMLLDWRSHLNRWDGQPHGRRLMGVIHQSLYSRSFQPAKIVGDLE